MPVTTRKTAGVLVLAVLLAVLMTSTAFAASISISPTAGPAPSQPISISGQGWDPVTCSGKVNLFVDGVPIGTAFADNAGNFSGFAYTMSGAPSSTHTVTASTANCKSTTSPTFRFDDPPPPTQPPPTQPPATAPSITQGKQTVQTTEATTTTTDVATTTTTPTTLPTATTVSLPVRDLNIVPIGTGLTTSSSGGTSTLVILFFFMLLAGGIWYARYALRPKS